MRLVDIESRIGRIRQLATDPERAHSYEDRLYLDVLSAIAAGTCEDPKAAALACLETQSIVTERWYS